jgi:hypothetical protein
MYQVANDVVRLIVATTSQELQSILQYLPHGVRFGIAHDLDETGEAHRFERLRHCAYYLTRHDRGIEVWRWSYIASQAEAFRLRALIGSCRGSLDEDVAARIFEQATRRSLANPRVSGMAYFATDLGERLGQPCGSMQ